VNVSPQAQGLRHAVGECIEPGNVVIGCSGGPDSLALAAAAAWAVPRAPGQLTAVIVDHELQEDSAQIAEQAARACQAVGIEDVEIKRVQVGTEGGPEAAARDARRAALLEVAERRSATQILLAHTRDDQAETVLLRAARGSGAEVVHEVAREIFEPLGFPPWDDPHNHDRRFARVRVRQALTQLESDLGPGLAANLARSAHLLGDDADALESWAAGAFERLVQPEEGGCSAELAALGELPRAVRTRVLRLMHSSIAGEADELDFDQVQQVEAMVSLWKGQGPARLPGWVTARVECGRLTLLVQPREL